MPELDYADPVLHCRDCYMDTMDSPMSPFTDGFLHVSRGWLCNDVLFLIFDKFRRNVMSK